MLNVLHLRENMTVQWRFLFCWITLFGCSSSHNGIHHSFPFLLESEAKTFFVPGHIINKRSAYSCITYEPYCEQHRLECMNYAENSREVWCSSKSCLTGQTCYMASPCPKHYTLGCSTNACFGLPCENGATCYSSGSNYTCGCTSTRYDGQNCEYDCRPGPADLLLIMDVSFTVSDHIRDAKKFASTIVNRLAIGPSDFLVAVVTYAFDAKLELDFTDSYNTSRIVQAIEHISAIAGPSYLDKALELAEEVLTHPVHGSRAYTHKYVMVISDGLSTKRTKALFKAARMRNQGIKIMSVGLGAQVGQTELVHLAYETRYLFTSTNDDAVNQILMETSDSNCTDCKQTTATDVIILLDLTSSQSNLQLSLDTITYVISGLRKYNDDTLIGMVTYNSKPSLKFNLTQYTDTNSLLINSQIGIAVSQEQANLTEALQFVRQYGFIDGRSPNSRQFVIILSEHNWTDPIQIKDEADTLRSSNVSVIYAPIGPSVNLTMVYDAARDGNDVYYIEEKDDIERFKTFFSRSKYFTCNETIFDRRQ